MNKTIVTLTAIAAMVCMACFGPPAHGAVIYTDSGAAGFGDGSSWADACTALQDALENAVSGDEIWVKAGFPSRSSETRA